jgi:hypothetical protein
MDAQEENGPVKFPASRMELNLRATPNTTGKDRSASIRLTAGTLYLDILVTQYGSAV